MSAPLPTKLREDLHDLAAVATLALAMVAWVGWVKTCPGWVVPQALSLIGVGAYVVARFYATVGAMALSAARRKLGRDQAASVTGGSRWCSSRRVRRPARSSRVNVQSKGSAILL